MATIGADSSGHGNAITYSSAYADTNLPGTVSVVIGNEDNDSSIYAQGSLVATLDSASMAPPASFEAWVRPTDPPVADAPLYSYVDDQGAVVREVRLTPTGQIIAVSRDRASNSETTLTGPPISTLEEGWHYIFVDYENEWIAVNGAPGTTTSASWSPCATCAAQTPRQTLGGDGYTGHLDEVALYAVSLPPERAAAHAQERGVDPASAGEEGGGESASRECDERGVFLFGVPSTPPYGPDPMRPKPQLNFDAAGASDAITTQVQKVICSKPRSASEVVALPMVQPVTKRTPRFTSGQTVRVKLIGDRDLNYAEWTQGRPTGRFCAGVAIDGHAQSPHTPA